MTRLFGLFLSALFLLPVPAAADVIGDVVTWPQGPAVLRTGNQVRVQWNYLIESPQGARIFARPMKDGATAPGYSGSGSPLFRGEGMGTGEFTLNQPGDVDAIRLQVFGPDGAMRLERVFPAQFRFAANPMASSVVPLLNLQPLEAMPRATGPLATADPTIPANPRLEAQPQLRPLVTPNTLRDLLASGRVFTPSLRIPDIITLPDGNMQPMQTLMGPPPPFDASMNAGEWVQSLERWLGFMTVTMGFDIQRLLGDEDEFDAYLEVEQADDPSVYEVLGRRRSAIGNLLDGI